MEASYRETASTYDEILSVNDSHRSPNVKQTSDFSGGKKALIRADACIGCGKCKKVSRFDAVHLNGPANGLIAKTYKVDPILCEGCKVCVEFCPEQAIDFNDSINGQWFISDTRLGPMVHAKLGIAEENSGKLVTLIRKTGREIAQEQDKNLLIVDGSPGIGCPVIASVTGADLVVIVTEPTLSGIHDLKRVEELVRGFNIPILIVINKYDLNPDMTQSIESAAGQRHSKVAGKIRYDSVFTKAQVMKCSVVEYTGGLVSEELKALWRNVIYALG